MPAATADDLFNQYCTLIQKLMQPEYQPTKHDELNLAALQHKIDQLEKQERDQNPVPPPPTPPRLPAAALYYAQVYRWPVFPLKPGTKTPATKHGFKDATTDIERIRTYWTRNPDANIGLPTGIHFDVIDVDLPEGPAQWETMRSSPGCPQIHAVTRTASGGNHYLIKPTGRKNGANLRPGIDYRGDGGYIVAPPSISADGQWTWINKPAQGILGGDT
jgi:hypothetical protein